MNKEQCPKLTILEQDMCEKIAYSLGLRLKYKHNITKKQAIIVNETVKPVQVWYIKRHVDNTLSATNPFDDTTIVLSAYEGQFNKQVASPYKANKMQRQRHAAKRIARVFDGIIPTEKEVSGPFAVLAKTRARLALQEMGQSNTDHDYKVIYNRNAKAGEPVCSTRIYKEDPRDIEVDCFTADKYR
jgi:hypothetical protein